MHAHPGHCCKFHSLCVSVGLGRFPTGGTSVVPTAAYCIWVAAIVLSAVCTRSPGADKGSTMRADAEGIEEPSVPSADGLCAHALSSSIWQRLGSHRGQVSRPPQARPACGLSNRMQLSPLFGRSRLQRAQSSRRAIHDHPAHKFQAGEVVAQICYITTAVSILLGAITC